MEYLKIKCDRATADILIDYYKAKVLNDPKRKYDLFQVTTHDSIQIKGYRTSNPEVFTVLFSGKDDKVVSEARIFFKNVPAPTLVGPGERVWEDTGTQIGSDEVGVGDFFLGFYVCAVYLTEDDVPLIDHLGVRDSKKLSDSKMLSIAPELRKRLKHHTVRISPTKLDELTAKGWSTHKILANTHNLAHARLMQSYHLPMSTVIYIDQFEKEGIYRHYCGSSIVKNPLIFRTKGESYFPSVAAASVLARAAFLDDWKKMEEELGCIIPKGAGRDANRVYISLVKKYGKEKLDPYVKRFFRNYENPEG